MRASVTRSTLRQQLADALRDEVLSGRLCPGREFTVKEIAESYGVSGTPVREALVDLAAQGLLDAVQHRGFRVHTYDRADYLGLVEASNLVTEGMFHVLADRSTTDPPAPAAVADSLLAVRRRGEEAGRAARTGELAILVGYDLRFWRELAVLYGNPYLSDFLHGLRVRSWACAVPVLHRCHDLRDRLWDEHTDLIDALLQQEMDTARTIVARYHSRALELSPHLSD
ncbi:GntR family transcriptional regulator [Streptomyces sp. NPDC058045]|uniref:GntR family transcriptional regulator n=1 Tax=Streptomyces sp. NPDC058045 TaxID=3346311 RepID=UPI0036EC4B75